MTDHSDARGEEAIRAEQDARDEHFGIRGSALTGVASTAAIISDGTRSWGTVPGGIVIAGRPTIYFLALCRECGDMVMPFGSRTDRDNWAVGHPHNVNVGVELRDW